MGDPDLALLLVTSVPAVTTQGYSHLQYSRFSLRQLALTDIRLLGPEHVL